MIKEPQLKAPPNFKAYASALYGPFDGLVDLAANIKRALLAPLPDGAEEGVALEKAAGAVTSYVLREGATVEEAEAVSATVLSQGQMFQQSDFNIQQMLAEGVSQMRDVDYRALIADVFDVNEVELHALTPEGAVLLAMGLGGVMAVYDNPDIQLLN
jgi:hypothetical protein